MFQKNLAISQIVQKAVNAVGRAILIALFWIAAFSIIAGFYFQALYVMILKRTCNRIIWLKKTSYHNRRAYVLRTVWGAVKYGTLPMLLALSISTLVRLENSVLRRATENQREIAAGLKSASIVAGSIDGAKTFVLFQEHKGRVKVLNKVSRKSFQEKGLEKEIKKPLPTPRRPVGKPVSSSLRPAPRKAGVKPNSHRQGLINEMWEMTKGDEIAIATMEIESGWNFQQREIVEVIVKGRKKLLPVGHGVGICQVDDRHWQNGSVLPNGEKLDWTRYLKDSHYQVHVCTVMYKGGVRMYGKDHTDRAIDDFFWAAQDS